jgi:hypothetical protein
MWKSAAPLAALVAAVALIPNCFGQVVSDGSFEQAKVNENSWVQGGESSGWTFNQFSGIARGNGAWGRFAHSGEQYAFLQSRGEGVGMMSQVIKGLTIGQEYRVYFWTARRNTAYPPIQAANVAIPITVLVDNATAFDFASTKGVGEWSLHTTRPFIAKTSGITLTFMAKSSEDSRDRTTLIDDVVLAPVFERESR